MTKSHVILKQTLQLDGDKFDVHIKVIEVPRSRKFPQGYKVSCALVDKSSGDLIILLDNHEPYGYHLHAKLPEDKNYRVSIDIRDYTEAIKFFFEEVKGYSMTNKKLLHIQFKSIEQIKAELLNSPIKKFIQPKNVILFESISGFRNFMTLQKLEILTIIASKKPKSIYELAKIVGRSIAPVQKDCNSLTKAGFILLEKEKGGRSMITPRLKFNYNRILIELPEFPYELSFRAAA